MKLQATATNIFRDPYLLIAFGFGSGLSKFAPGTAGTLLAIPLYLLLIQLGAPLYVVIVLLATLVGIWICDVASERLGVHDHSGIVWDEIVGLWITMIAIPATLQSIACGFVLFRLFDIVKPWPIRWLDQNVKGGFGIMVDDVLAAMMANICLQILFYSGVLYSGAT
ncbi:MAG TPA: phosphatidylglycerophosphatase A [Crenotrichaceae bacterium]|nr:phosphatidylglycerophosphatase A [Crenotrichaceae bacterium]